MWDRLASVWGGVKLKRFLFPWGRVYFVLDGSLFDNPFRKARSELIEYVADRMKGLEKSQSAKAPGPTEDRYPFRTWLIVDSLASWSLLW